LFFTPQRVDDWTAAAGADVARFATFFQAMLARGIVLAPSQFEANFISAAHTPGDIETTIAAGAAALETACA
jgi:glutamate-1-semialdehyde 2,1-aminomutase